LHELDPYNPTFYGESDDGADSSQEEHDDERHYTPFHRQPRPLVRPESPQPAAQRPRASGASPFAQHPLVSRPAPVAAPRPAPADELPHRRRGIDLGKRVRHPLLGEGIVSGISGSGSNLQLILQLDDGGVHHLLARYANLEVLED
jgi:hypothetical protein